MRYEEEYFVAIVNRSKTLSEVARNLELEPSKGNRDTIKKYIKLYNISTEHFHYRHNVNGLIQKRKLQDVLIINSDYDRKSLKRRLYNEGLKQRICEKCGQDENWNGEKISLILDHINGISNDNRLENLRILCPNCNATLETNCGKNKKQYNYKEYNFCIDCNIVISKQSKRCSKCDHIKQRKCIRPPYVVLLEEVENFGCVKIGRKYDVSDVTIKKWLKSYNK